ncbi:MAG: DNA polymerase III subunit alpha [Xanthomonadales bacterium]|nr:DNA polymerase III subunit alpha [Xanthomonadales bacterium]MDL1868568.1 DNA polymerase III subunit alpha [Gammaproteobacteria bacterium PRO6]
MSASFIHLHVHSEYSLIDSTIRIDELVKACARLDMPAVALTDQSNLFALVKFYKAAEAAGVKPIAGCDLWLADEEEAARPQRVLLLCQDRQGYLALSHLVSRSYAENRHGERALVDPSWLDEANGGLIAIAGQDSDIGRLLLAQRAEAALQRAQWWRERFPNRLYLQATRIERAGEEVFLAGALDLGARLALPLLAGNDVRFLEREDFEAHEARVCIHAGRVLADPRRPRDYTPEQYLKPPAAMAQRFADLPELLANTVELARRCNLELSFGKYYLPAFPVPAQHTLDSYIGAQARDGLAARLAVQPLARGFAREDYDQRLDRELEVIVQMGFAGYFLIVADFINWAKDNDIPVGPGRGSGAGSLVAWSLGITDLDPLRYGLLFERFLNPERVSMPDFDVDFCMDRRDEVIDYVSRKYGRDRVSQIITYGTMAAKAVLRDTGRVLGLPYGQVDRIAKLLPRMPLDLTLEDALGRSDKSRHEPTRVVAEFRDLYAGDEETRELVDLALKLEDLTRNAGKHAGGVVIAPAPLHEFAPLYSEGGDGLVTQFDKDDVEAVGLVKFDFLGLRTLTIIDWAVKAINAARAAAGGAEGPLDIMALPLDDPAVFELFRHAHTVAVFQFESRGMQRLLVDARPDSFEDLIALVALYRPGPMELIPSFCARKHGREVIEYPDPRVELILRETYGIMVYQEQVMQMAQIVGGYSLGGADLLRRAMGKKKAEEMAKERVKFRSGAAANGLDEAKADAIFDLMEKFAGYGFNKSHAAAYALVAYQTAWLKAHHPAPFMAAVLSADMDGLDKVVGFIDEARALGLTINPPHVNHSQWKFAAIDAHTIQYGLGAVKGVGHAGIDNIVAAREHGGAFRDLADFCARIDPTKVNKRVFDALILAGALDGLGPNRASLAEQLPEALRAAEQRARDAQSGQFDIFGASPGSPALATPTLAVVDEWPLAQRLAGERETLGHYLSGHPTDPWRELLAQLTTCTIGTIDKHYKPPREGRLRVGEMPRFTLAGSVVGLRKLADGRVFVGVEDASGKVEVALFSEAWLEFGPLLTRDAILVFEGGLSFDDFVGGYVLRIGSVWTIDEACVRRARLLRLTLDDADAAVVTRLQHTLDAHRGGTTPVRLCWRNHTAAADIELGADWHVRASHSLADTLRTLDGVSSAELVLG